jgi:hypothetical protein
MISRSPWLQATKTAADMTARNVNGQLILQKRRAKGTFTPSAATLNSHIVAAMLWPIYRSIQGLIRSYWQMLGIGQTTSGQFYSKNYDKALLDVETGWIPSDLADVQISKGPITRTFYNSAPIADVSADTVAFTMPTAVIDETQNADDQTKVVAYNLELGTYSFGTLSNRAALATGTVTLPEGTQVGHNIVIWTFQVGAPLGLYPGGSSQSVGASTVAVA